MAKTVTRKTTSRRNRKNIEKGRNSLQPDAKCQLSFEYNGKGSRPILKAAVISHQHLESADAEELKKVFHGMIYGNIPDVFLYGDFDYYFNPTVNDTNLEYDSKNDHALVRVKLYSGRGHQIRVQLKSIKCPIYGDQKYGGEGMAKVMLNLFACELSFNHPTTKQKLIFRVYPPETESAWNEFRLEKYLFIRKFQPFR